MNRKSLALASALIMGISTSVLAGETVGTITAMDDEGTELTLDDGTTYAFGVPECSSETMCAVETFAVGDKVRILWDLVNDRRVVTGIAAVPQ